MSSSFNEQLCKSIRGWWVENAGLHGFLGASSQLISKLWDFVGESTPSRRRQRYGDMEYDWEHRVNTTSGTVGWHARLLGLFHSPYQPTDPVLFQEMMASLPIPFDKFTFVDLGSGKGRTLLMASEYPFRKILGVELISELHHAAEENIRDYRSPTQRCTSVESVVADAREYELPEDPLVLFLFNPLPERALSEVLRRLGNSLMRVPRPVWVVYHNPLLESALGASGFLKNAGGTQQYSVYRDSVYRVAERH